MHEELTKLVRHGVVYGLGRVLTKGIGFLLIPLYTHYLSPTDFGVMEILNLVTTVAGIVLGLGLGSALMRFYYATEDGRERSRLVSTITLSQVLLGFVCCTLLYLGAGPASALLLGTRDHEVLVKIVAAAFFFTFSSDVGWTLLRAKQRSGLYVVLLQGQLLVNVVLNIWFVAYRGMGVRGVFWGTFFAGLVQWVVVLWITFRDVGFVFDPAVLSRSLRFGSPMIFTWLAAFSLNYSDRFFLQRFANLEQVGIYALAYKFGYVVSLLAVQPFYLIWEAQCYQIAKREDGRAVFSKLFTYYTVALIAVAFLLSLFIRECFEIAVGSRFTSAYAMVPVIGWAYVIQGAGLFFEAGLLIEKKSRTVGAIGFVSMALCFFLNWVLIEPWAAWGACAATVASFVVLAGATAWFSLKAHPIRCDLGPILEVGGLAVAILVAAAYLSPESLVLRLVLKSATAAVVALVALRLAVFRDASFREIVGKLAAGFRDLRRGHAVRSDETPAT